MVLLTFFEETVSHYIFSYLFRTLKTISNILIDERLVQCFTIVTLKCVPLFVHLLVLSYYELYYPLVLYALPIPSCCLLAALGR
jgi:hypothetical protein